ncbi:MAG TPA: RNA 3'-terminal phosphate cyclase [Thermoplasmata archaeon]|nr:RNA 3'-terminal phosphate cyclase [Thermoplasmata archaeon]
MIEVDGSHGEGGGQLVRMGVALSALTETPVRIVRIRAGRPAPGLAAQHVTAIQAIAALCGAESTGVAIGASSIEFRPGKPTPGRLSFDVGTAGSVTLVLQALLPVAAAAPAPVRVRLVGGTDVRWSPPIDYFSRVFLPILRTLGGHTDVEVSRRGYYPRGGGVVDAVIEPTRTWSPLRNSEAGETQRVRGIAHVSNLPEDVPKRMAHAALRRLHGIPDVKIEQRVYHGEEAIGQGGALVLCAETDAGLLGSDSLAERGKPSERIGEEVAASLRTEIESQATFDVHAADQLLIYLARADGPSEFRARAVSGHMETMMWLIPQFVPCGFAVTREAGGWQVSVEPGA